MNIQALRAEGERREAVPVLRQLWRDAEPAEILAWTGHDDYHLFGGFVDGELVRVAGVVVTHMLHHVRHAWLYDLVVDDARREEGHGTALVEFVEEWATEKGCEHVALASPLAKEGTHQYYEDRDYEKWGYVLEKQL